MKAFRYALPVAGIFLAVLCRAADLSAPVEVMALKDGRILHHVVFVGFGASTTVAKWAEGRGTIAYELLPDDVRAAAERRRPVPSPDLPPAQRAYDSQARGDSAAQREADREHRAAEAIRQKEQAERAVAVRKEQAERIAAQKYEEQALARGWIKGALSISKAVPTRSGAIVTIENNSVSAIDIDWQMICGVSPTGDLVPPTEGLPMNPQDDWSVPPESSKQFVIGFGAYLRTGNKIVQVRWKPDN